MKEFLNFVREQGVVGLAIGFIVGGASKSVVDSLVADVLNPIIGLVLPANSLAEASFMIGESEIVWGNFVNELIGFIIILAVVFYVFKAIGLEKLDKKKD